MSTRKTSLIIAVLIGLFAADARAQSTGHARPAPSPTPAMAAASAAPAADAQQASPASTGEAIAPQAPTPPQPPAPPTPPTAPRAATAPRAPEPLALSRTNVKVEVTITDQPASGSPTRKSISLTVGDGQRGSVRSGVTIPIPSTSFANMKDDNKPMVSYTYRDVGLNLDVENVLVQGNLIRLRLGVEYNPVDEKTAGAEGPALSATAPGAVSFARFSQQLTLVLEDGKPLVVAQSSDPVPSRNRTASLEVKATILK
jgi:hypothetical protein